MRKRVPDWLIQVTAGLNNGRKWIVRKLKGLPTLPRYGGWFVFQAVLYKIQPQLWYALVDVTELITRALALPLHLQLLMVVIGLLIGQTLLTENRFNRTWKVVKNMDKSQGSGSAVTDGGPKNELATDAYNRSSWRVYVVCCAIIGGIIGVNLGPAGVIGLAVLGAMLGDDWAKRTLGD